MGSNDLTGAILIIAYVGYVFFYPIFEFWDMRSIEYKIHEKINLERQQQGLPPLSFDSKLQSAARNHSNDMGIKNYFEHVSPDGTTPTSRGKTAGYNCFKMYGGGYSDGLGENIAKMPIASSFGLMAIFPWAIWNDKTTVASQTVESWMNSPGHRENILTPHYSTEGIGVYRKPLDTYVYITEDFC